MTLTTPSRPQSPLAAVPELSRFERSAVRLHPRGGDPEVDQSSVGGPLLWPAEEPWPRCALAHEPDGATPTSRAARLRLAKEDLRRFRSRTGPYDPDRDERETRELALSIVREAHPEYDPGDPVPLVPVAQLYYRDVPHLPWPDRFDLLQVLWCPLNHTGNATVASYCPAFQLRWRRAATVGTVLAEPPAPVMAVETYLPNRCVVHPESIGEYPEFELLPDSLQGPVADWEGATGCDYGRDFALAPGWKVMGHGARWGIIDPYPMFCECGAEQLPLLAACTGEGDGSTRSWWPVEEAVEWSIADPVGVTIGRGYTLQLYYCPASERHANLTEMF